MDLHIYVPQMVGFINAPWGAIEINNLIHFRDCAVIASHYGNNIVSRVSQFWDVAEG